MIVLSMLAAACGLALTRQAASGDNALARVGRDIRPCFEGFDVLAEAAGSLGLVDLFEAAVNHEAKSG
jgi:hypothetical protein